MSYVKKNSHREKRRGKVGPVKMSIRKVDKPPYVVNDLQPSRYDQRNIIFNRVLWDRSWQGYGRMIDERVPDIISENKPGYSKVDFALDYASWTVHDAFKGGFSWERIKPHKPSTNTRGINWSRMKFVVDDPGEMSLQVKRASKLFGASLVGICKLNRHWLYADVEIPKNCENVIVIAIEMDPIGIATSPAVPAAAATGIGYSKMAFVAALLGEFIRNLGFEAVQAGNDTALSIPLAIDAGLGQLGRNGLLITPKFGPRVRLCKIFTDLPLEVDKPIDFGVTQFCKKCKLCAEVCEVGAISKETEPSFQIACRSNNPGALKWYVNGELCYQFWCENGTDCSTCIAVCPYNVPLAGQKVNSHEFWRV